MYVFFFEFGRRLFSMAVSSTKSYSRKLSGFLPFWFSLLMGFIIALRIILYPDDLNAGVIIARYFLGIPAGILTGLGFILYCNFNHRPLEDIKIRQSFLMAGISFLVYGVLGGFLLGVGRMPVPWQALLLSIVIYVALPLIAGYFSRKWIVSHKGIEWFNEKFLHLLSPVSIMALLFTLVLLFSFKGMQTK